MQRVIGSWSALAWFGFAVLPWNAIGGGGFFAFQWLRPYPLSVAAAPALVQLVWHGRLWFLPLLLVLLAPLTFLLRRAPNATTRQTFAWPLVAVGSAGLICIGAIALAIDINGWAWTPLGRVFGELPRRQQGLGYGAIFVSVACLMLMCHGLALRGWVKGDTFVAGCIGISIALVSMFTIYPLTRMFLNAFLDS